MLFVAVLSAAAAAEAEEQPTEVVVSAGDLATEQVLTPPEAPEPDATPADQGELEIVVRSVRPARAPLEVALSARQAEQTAGSQGDAAKALQALPGVARAGAQAEPILWGAAPRETGIYIDDVPLPFLYFGSGVRSVVPSPWLASVRLVPGAYDLSLGRRLGGVVRLETQDADLDGTEFRVSVDTLDTAALVGMPLGRSQGVRVGARYGHIGAWLPRFIDEAARGLYVIPDYWDTQAQALFELDSGARLKVQWVSGHESSAQDLLAGQRPTLARSLRSFERLYAVYERETSEGRTRLTTYLGRDTNDQTALALGTPTRALERALLGGLRAEYGHYVSQDAQLRVGLDSHLGLHAGQLRGSLAVPPREGDLRLFGQPPARDYVSDDIELLAVSVAPYLAGRVDLGAFSAGAGLRLETHLLETQRSRPPIGSVPDTGTSRLDALLAPQANLEWALSEQVQLFSALSRHHQPPDALDLGAYRGSPRLPAASATHLVAGQTAHLSRALSVEVAVFQKWLEGLATRTLDPYPRPGEVLEPQGSGRAFGAQALMRVRPPSGYSGWVSATVSRSVRRDAPGSRERPFDFDQPLALSGVLQKELGAFQLGVRARYAAGFPRPAVVQADHDLLDDRYEPILSRERWWRLPAFFALDLRVERRFPLGAGGELAAYVEALNVTHHKNAEEVVYSRDYRSRTYLLGLPAMGVVGVRYSQ